MDIAFKILAVILAGVAAYFLWQGSGDRAFVAAVAGSVSFFLSVRVQVRKRLEIRETEREEEEERRKRESEMAEFAEFDEEEFDEERTLLNGISADRRIDNQQRTTDNEQKI